MRLPTIDMTMRMRRLIIKPSSITLLATLLAQTAILLCSALDCSAVQLKVNAKFDQSSTAVTDKAESAVLRQFLELHPDIRLTKATGLQLQNVSQSMDMVPLMQIAGDISPDVLYVNFRTSDTYIRKGFLRPLDDFVKAIPKEELDRRVPPSIRDVMYREGPDGRKHWYMLPTGRVVRALTYRRDLFRRAGLDPNKPPRTWSEFEAYSARLTDPAKDRYGMLFVKGDVAAWDFANLVWSRGGDIIARDRNGEWMPAFNTPEVVDALYFYVQLCAKKVKGSNGRYYRGLATRDAALNTNATDHYAMRFDYLDDRLNVFQPELMGYAPVPRSDNAVHSASEINAKMLGIYAGVKDPSVVRAAFEYILFQDSDEANRIRVKIYIQNGYGKFVNPEFLHRFKYFDYLKQVNRDWIKVYNDVLTNGKAEPYGKNCSMVYRELSRPIEQSLTDSKVLSALDRGDEQAVKQRLRQILNRAQAESAKKMYGILPPPVKALRHNLTLLFLVLTGSGFALATGYLMRMFRRSAPSQTPGQKKAFFAYVLLIPAVASVLIWQYYPLIRGTVIAFQDYNVIGNSPFVGLQNFAAVLFDADFWHSIYVTLVYTALYMGFGFLSPIFLALLLSEVPRGKIFFRTMFYLPAVLSGLVVIFLWKSFYTASGLLNTMLNGFFGLLHIPVSVNYGWLDSPALAMAAVLLPVIWAGMGPGCLIYLAALKTIPEELYEASEVDGAGIARKIFSITLPSIKMLIMINLVGAFIGAFMSSESILAMTGGGPYTPHGATEVVGLQLFYTAFMYLKFGVANAMAWVLGFMLIGFTMFQLRNLSRVEFKGGR